MQRLVLFLAFAFLVAPLSSRVLPEPDASGRRASTSAGATPAALDSASGAARGAEAESAPLVTPDLAIAPAPAAYTRPAEDSIYRFAAEVAWRYVDEQYQSETGLVNSVIGYPYATVWDIGSTLAAYHSAHALGLLADDVYSRRVAMALETLRTLPLFDDAAFNKNYHVDDGELAGRNDRETAVGYGWSATDIGRLLVWLKIIATADTAHAAAARAVVDRLDLDRLVADGYLRGEDLDGRGEHRAYQEGRVGYEQYAAAGFALWGQRAEHALDIGENTRSVDVLGVPVLTDIRPNAHLTSEPYFLLGLELGWWDSRWKQVSDGILGAQKARSDSLGQITIASEDALPVPPHYFYYYTVLGAGEDFAVLAPDAAGPLEGPRWISAKGAFAWYAVHPGEYTWEAVQAVLAAADPALGWASGVYESSGLSTGGQNINTAAVILEAALYRRVRRPLLSAAGG